MYVQAAAVDSLDSGAIDEPSVMHLFDFTTGRTRVLVPNVSLGGYYWENDSRNVYYYGPFHSVKDRAMYRVNIQDSEITKIVSVGETRPVRGVLDQ